MSDQLDEAALAAALAYNEKRDYDAATIERIQQTVRTAQRTGRFDRPTVEAVAGWQNRIGLTPDGKVGPDTLALIKASRDMTIGVWVDDAPSAVLDPQFFDRLGTLRLTTIAILVQASTANSKE